MIWNMMMEIWAIHRISVTWHTIHYFLSLNWISVTWHTAMCYQMFQLHCIMIVYQCLCVFPECMSYSEWQNNLHSYSILSLLLHCPGEVLLWVRQLIHAWIKAISLSSSKTGIFSFIYSTFPLKSCLRGTEINKGITVNLWSAERRLIKWLSLSVAAVYWTAVKKT